MSTFRKKRGFIFMLIALIIMGANISCAAQDPSETVDGGSESTTYTTTVPQETTSAPASLTTAATTAEKQITPKLQNAATITFDDGPGEHTGRLLDAFKEYDAKATFFVLGNKMKDNSALIQRMVDEGHEVANHSYDHSSFNTLSDAELLSQIRRTNSAIAAITDEKPTLLRPPFGEFPQHITHLAEREGLALVLWEPSPDDWLIREVDYVYEYIIDTIEPGSTLLLHDIHETTVDAMIKALPVLAERGLKLVTVSELFDLKPGDMYPPNWEPYWGGDE
ncbi:MAG: polysaccharide deacetylase family protein [Bacillota bacterium]|nr:polysaccharide deacetylase family protein [Bacillota bacterium]